MFLHPQIKFNPLEKGYFCQNVTSNSTAVYMQGMCRVTAGRNIQHFAKLAD
jgi:hypothetical protein